MATDTEIMKARLAGQAQSYGLSTDSAAITEAGKVHTYHRAFDKAADDAMASTTTAETYLGRRIPYRSWLKSIYYTPTTGGITASDTVNITVTISVRDSAGANKTTIATLTTTTTSSGSLTQGVPKALVLTSANVIIAAGSTLTYEVAKTSTGTILRAGEFILELEKA